jgi:hypothetical protein
LGRKAGSSASPGATGRRDGARQGTGARRRCAAGCAAAPAAAPWNHSRPGVEHGGQQLEVLPRPSPPRRHAAHRRPVERSSALCSAATMKGQGPVHPPHQARAYRAWPPRPPGRASSPLRAVGRRPTPRASASTPASTPGKDGQVSRNRGGREVEHRGLAVLQLRGGAAASSRAARVSSLRVRAALRRSEQRAAPEIEVERVG